MGAGFDYRWRHIERFVLNREGRVDDHHNRGLLMRSPLIGLAPEW
jgi:hypothetical protein